MKYTYESDLNKIAKQWGKQRHSLPSPDIQWSFQNSTGLHLIDWVSKGSHGKSPNHLGCCQHYRLFSTNLVQGPLLKQCLYSSLHVEKKPSTLQEGCHPAATANRVNSPAPSWRFRVSDYHVRAFPFLSSNFICF